MRKLLMRIASCEAVAVTAGATLSVVAGTTADATIRVDTTKVRFPVAPDLWGIFFEDIDLSLDGGIYAEKVRNPSFEHWEIGRWKKGLPFEYWQTLGNADLRIENYRSPCGGNRRYAKIRAGKGAGFANEFTAATPYGKKQTKRVLAEGFNHSLKHKKAQSRQVCYFRKDELGAGDVRFMVTPLNCFGARGRPLTAGLKGRKR